MDAIATLVKSILQKESLHDCSVEELQTIARQYSYFTPVQFLLVEKLKSANGSLYKEQLQKLALHFNNPLWLDYLLNGYKTQTTVITKSENEKFIEETTTVEEKQENIEALNKEPFSKSEFEISEPVNEEINESPDKNAFAETITVQEKQENIETPIEEPFIKSESEISEPISEEINESANENIFTETTIAEEKQENIQPPAEETETGSVSEIQGTSGEEVNDQQISIPPLPDLKQEPTETEITFEPYHTVDYFASQGIKFVAEEKPADRFGQQLKSFTEWLKTLKRLPQTEIPKISETIIEEKVQQLAEHSISEDEVVTETMAEVWLKQGNKEKAIETYNKLSLLNPAKSAYFASLAEQLKNN